MVRNNEAMIKGMQSTIDRGVAAFSNSGPSNGGQAFKKSKGGTKGGGKNNGGKKGGAKGGGKANNGGGQNGGDRKVKMNAGFNGWRKRTKKNNANQ